ncbi:MAG TPA: PEGA domain-containing protein [Kofleriaceae bacterium]
MLLVLVAIGLAHKAAPLRAQPANEAVIAGAENAAWNRGVPAETRQAARDLFLEGNRLFKIPLFTQAADKYIAAIAKWKHPAFYFNLAVTQLNLGQQLEAHQNLQEALKHGAPPLGEDRYAEAQKQLKEVEAKLGRIRVSCPTSGAEVTLDGDRLFTGPGSREEWVKASTHQVTAKKPEYETQARQVTVAAGKLAPIELSLRKLIEDRPWATWKPWAVVGTGVAVAAASGVLHGFSARNFGRYDDGFLKLGCANTGCTEQQIHDMNSQLPTLLDRARLEQKIAVGGYIAGGSLIAIGAVLVYLNRPHLMEQGSASSPSGGVAIVPTVSTDAVGVLVTVRH